MTDAQTTDGVKSPVSLAGRRFDWLTPAALARVRGILVALTLFVGLAVYVFQTLGPLPTRADSFVVRLQRVGVLTWLYALVQMIDMRFYNSRFAQRRRIAAGIPDSLQGLLFGQMIAWYGILYYGLTADIRPFIAGVVILGAAFWVFPIRKGD